MTNNFPELHLLLAQTAQEYRRGLQQIIGAPAGDSPTLLCDHLSLLRAGAAGQVLDQPDYKQLVTDIADKVAIDWSSVLGQTTWAGLSAGQVEAAIVRHVEADKIYLQDSGAHLPNAIAALDDAFSSLSSDWRKLLAAVIYIHQVIRPAGRSMATPAAVPQAHTEPESKAAPAPAPTLAGEGLIEDPAATQESHPALEPTRKTGVELFHSQADPLGPTLLDFWAWSASDLVSQATRSALGAYLVSCALGLEDGVRSEADCADVLLLPGGLKLEVRSASCLPSWFQQNAVRFPIRSTRHLESGPNVLGVDLKLRADIYVFCLLAHRDQKTLDPLDVSQWEFYVAASSVLDANFPLGQSVGLASLPPVGVLPITYDGLADEIAQYIPAAAIPGR